MDIFRYLGLRRKKSENHRIVYATDLHGNQKHYRLVLAFAEKCGADLIIFGGDNAPKSKTKRSPEKQLRFFEKGFTTLFRNFRIKNGNSTKIFMIYGNDDFKSYLPELGRLLSSFGVSLLSNDIVNYENKFNIIGYSYVPITPFRYKDWEKFDTPGMLRDDARPHGVVSQTTGFRAIDSAEISSRTTIEEDLAKLFAQAELPTVLISHAPPADTCLDVINGGRHVGSVAVKKAIEKYRPHLSFHGHIHESYEITKIFAQKIGRTIAINPGHFFDKPSSTMVIVDFDPTSPADLRSVLRVDIEKDSTIGQFSSEHTIEHLAKSDRISRAL
jgi:Icc-related predicted phosphoesterase